MINIIKIDENYLQLKTSPEIFKHIYDNFRIKDKNCYFNPRYKKKQWDGYIKFIFNNGFFLNGLLVEVLRLAKLNNWKIKFDQKLILNKYKFTDPEIKLSLKGVDFYDDQFEHLHNILKYRTGLIKLPTSTGKSYLEISLMNLYKLKGIDNQILIVPRSSLVEQIYSDITTKSGFIQPVEVGRLYGGLKEWDKSIIIATWQSLNNIITLDKNYTKRFKLLIQDEVHVSSSSAKEVKKIIMSFDPDIKYGFSATILSKNSNPLEYYNSTSLFGAIISVDNVKNLQSKDRIAKTDIHLKLLKHPNNNEIRTYQDYEAVIRSSPLRRKYIKSLIDTIRETDKDGNILILIRNVDLIKEFNEYLLDYYNDVHMIYGQTQVSDRVKIKKYVEEHNGQILLATTGVFSIGENVKNLHHLILMQSRKSELEIIQQIGRLLRINKNKKKAYIYDIVDDLIVVKETEDGKIIRKNFGKRHMKERIKALKEHQFEVNDIEFVKL